MGALADDLSLCLQWDITIVFVGQYLEYQCDFCFCLFLFAYIFSSFLCKAHCYYITTSFNITEHSISRKIYEFLVCLCSLAFIPQSSAHSCLIPAIHLYLGAAGLQRILLQSSAVKDFLASNVNELLLNTVQAGTLLVHQLSLAPLPLLNFYVYCI